MTYKTRRSLVEPLAIARVQYERYVESLGYTPAAWTPMVTFVRGEVRKMAERGDRIYGVQCRRTVDGWYFQARVDWVALAAQVERALPSWRAAVERHEGPVEVLA